MRPAATRRALSAAAAACALGLAAGCANVPAALPRGDLWTASAPRDSARVARPDTVPSRAAREVLAGIPEPLAPGEAVPPPAEPARPEAAAPAAAETTRSEIPVPEPTPVLGERPLPGLAAPADTSGPGGPPPPALVSPHAAAPARGDTCWRVQIAASAERVKAERYQRAGESQLLVRMTVVKERRLFKVRTTDCLARAEADALKRRAANAGFSGVFLIGERRR